MTTKKSNVDFPAAYGRLLEVIGFMLEMKLEPHQALLAYNIAKEMEKYERTEFPQFNDGEVGKNV